MTTSQLNQLRNLKNDDTLSFLYKLGVLSPKAFLLLDFNNYMQARSSTPKTQVVNELAKAYKLSERTVWKYLAE